jgi:hypothetical protein
MSHSSRDSSVGTATGYGLDGRGSIPGRNKKLSAFLNVQVSSESHPASYTKKTGGDISSEVKRLGHQADNSPPCNVEVKNDGAIPPLSIRLHGVYLYLYMSETSYNILPMNVYFLSACYIYSSVIFLWQAWLYFVAFLALENFILRLEGKPTIRLNDGITSLSNGLIAECGRYVCTRIFMQQVLFTQTVPVLKHAKVFKRTQILSRVWGSVTNNNGFWIGWLDLLVLL